VSVTTQATVPTVPVDQQHQQISTSNELTAINANDADLYDKAKENAHAFEQVMLALTDADGKSRF
jgi:Tfp pilus assembly protein PilV